ncbi:MAG: hypothetical protein AAFP19_03510 [Bacteroidota bacterium]
MDRFTKKVVETGENEVEYCVTLPATVGLTPLWRGVSPTEQPSLSE